VALVRCSPESSSEALCGSVPVFEDRVRRGRKIDIHVVVIPGIGGSTRTPLFFLEGGPGLAASDGVELWEKELGAYRRDRDVVLVDQRGTGKSSPLFCERDRRTAADFLGEMYPVEYVRRCRSALESRADLTRYTTPAAADDLEEVRKALGYERIDVFGLSYGTRLALVMLKRHPKSVRAAVLMGVAPTWARMPLYHSANADRALKLLLQDCAGEAPCAAAFPDLPGDLATLDAALRREPAHAEASWPSGAAPTPVSIEHDVFMEAIRRAMYAPASSRWIPLVIHAAAHGDYAPFLRMALRSAADARRDADGLYLSVTCTEDTSRIEPGEADRFSAPTATVFGRYRVDQQTRACSLWPTTKAPAGWDSDVRSRVPVLILSGGRDPVTPPSWASRVARRLPRSLHVVVPLSAHIDEGLDTKCTDGVVLAFLERGTVNGLDTSCLTRQKPAPFATAP
jgi:pimeloyl-ACP methyl ester carboxylesterase